MILERCQGIAVNGKDLPNNLTQEMTSGELKFALHVEARLNTIPQPEYRQLVVEALMVLALVVEHDLAPYLGETLQVEQLVHKANRIFLEDQMKVNGDATLCCAKSKDDVGGVTLPCSKPVKDSALVCGGAANICQHFYDSAPSGCYGTMTYLVRSVAQTLTCLPKDGQLDCNVA